MAAGSAPTLGILDNVVIASAHMYTMTGNRSDIIDMIVTSFKEDEIKSAKTELIEFVGMNLSNAGHRDTAERSAAYLYAKELVALVYELDKENRMPKVVVSSDMLYKVPFGKKGLSPSEVVPISARMNNIEEMVKKLSDSFTKFQKDYQGSKTAEKSFADVAAGGVAGIRPRGHAAASDRRTATPTVHVQSPSPIDWASHVERENGQVTPRQHALRQSSSHLEPRGSSSRSVSPKRPREDDDADQFQKPKNRSPRKVAYGKSKVTIEGAEAAPVEFYIGNTNPRATPDIISKVLKKCALDLPEKVELEITDVKCLNNLQTDPSPRTKCWKITVPYRFKEFMYKDDLYYDGWTHRPFYPPRQNRAKRHQPDPKDPVAQHLEANMEGA